METVHVGLEGRAYDIHIGPGLLAQSGALIKPLLKRPRVAIVTDENVARLHLDNLKGINAHHQAETLFKAFGRALRMALTPDPRMAGVVPSTKGSL